MTPEEAQHALNELDEQFTLWRKNKKHHREMIPEALLQKASNLSAYINERQVRSRLGLSSKSFKRLNVAEAASNSEIESSAFAEITLPKALEVEIRSPDGTAISIRPTSQSAWPIIRRILEEVESC